MAGLDSIKGYEDGGAVAYSADSLDPSVTKNSGGLSLKANSKGMLVPSAKEIVADPAATKDLLGNMERMIAEKSDPWKNFQNSLARASAWTVDSQGGRKAEALNRTNAAQSLEDQELFNMQQQLAGYKAAQSSAANDSARLASLTSGAGAMGAEGPGQIPMDVQARMQAARTDTDRLAILDEWRKGRVVESTKKEFSPQMATVVKVFNPLTNKVEEMTQANAERILNSKPELFRGYTQQPTGGGAVSGDAASRVAARESGGKDMGYHDLTKGTAYGTYGITDAAYKDVQSANPKFKDRPITSLNKDEQTEAFNSYRGLAQNQLTKLGIEPSAQNLDLAHFLGPTGAANYVKTGAVSPEAAASNGGEAKAKQIADGILSGKPVATSQGTTGLEAAPKQPAAKTTGYTGPLMPDGSKPTTRDEYDMALANQRLTAEEDIKTVAKGRSSELSKSGEDTAARKSATILAYNNADTNIATVNYIDNIAKSNPRAFGVLQDPTVSAAIGKALQGGVTAGISVGAKNIEDAVRQAMPNATPAEISAASKAANGFAKLQLNAALVVLKGQGAVSDAERELVARMTGSASNSQKDIEDFMKWTRLRSEYDKNLGRAQREWEKTNPNKSHRDFELTPQFETLEADYKAKIDAVADDTSKDKTKPKPAHPGAALLDLYPPKKAR